MAVSKAFLFEEDEQLASTIGQAMAHPARMRMLRKLISGNIIGYSFLISDMPLSYNAIKQHVDILKRLGFIQPAMLEDNTVGFQLDRAFYYACAAAGRRILRRGSEVRLLGVDGFEAETG